MKFDMTKEYKTKRERDQAIEAWLRGELEKTYKVKGLSPEYNTIENSGLKGEAAKKQVKDLELKGFDVKLSYGSKEPIICDEKAFTSKISESSESYVIFTLVICDKHINRRRSYDKNIIRHSPQRSIK